MTTTSQFTRRDLPTQTTAAEGPPMRRLLALLALVSVAYALAQLIIVTPRIGLAWDEVVYASQVAKGVPPGLFTAPRARGIPVLVAPVLTFTDSIPVLRVYLIVLSSLALFGAFAVWLRVRRSYVVPAGAFLFASTWLAVFYGTQVMPNLWDAFAGVAAVGFFMLAVRRPTRGNLVGLALSLAFAALVRPSDSAYMALPLVVAVVVVPAWRRLSVFAALVIGELLGWAEWIIEAYVRYGGFLARLHAAAAENMPGLHVMFVKHAEALNGPIQCRPPADCGPVPIPGLIWWIGIPVMTAVGLYASRRAGRLAPTLMLTLSGLSIGASYLFLVGYAAPRFLLPSYALLAIPVAEGAAGLLRVRPPARYATAALVVCGVAAHVAIQGRYLVHVAHHELRSRTAYAQTAAELRGLGVHPPCLLYGNSAVMVGFPAKCKTVAVVDHWGGAQVPRSIRTALRHGERVAVIVHGSRMPAPFLQGWRKIKLTHVDAWGNTYVYLPPGQGS